MAKWSVTTSRLMVLVEWDRPGLATGLSCSVWRKMDGLGQRLSLLQSETCYGEREG